MTELFYVAAVLACPVGMGLMMWFMMRPKKSEPTDAAGPAGPSLAASEGELARLRAEVDQLQAALREDRAERPSHPGQPVPRLLGDS